MAETIVHPAAAERPQIKTMQMSDLGDALQAGWQDFKRAPGLGLFFGTVLAIGGWVVVLTMFITDRVWLALPVTVGFPLLGPFAAVGLYEISRRLKSGESWRTGDILGVIWRQKDRQVAMLSWLIITYFLFWSFFAHMLFALFLGPSALTNVTSSYAFLLQPEGLSMLLVGGAIGAVFAILLFSLTVVALPMLLDRELDFVTSMLTSMAVVRANPKVMLSWGVVISVLLFVAMLPGFIGLVAVFPVLGHASWHIYLAAVSPAEE